MFPSYRNQSVDLQSKSTDWFLYDENIGRERVNFIFLTVKRKRSYLRIFFLCISEREDALKHEAERNK